MARACTICTHPERVAIDHALVAGEPYRGIARRFAVSDDAVERHAAHHLPALLTKAQQERLSQHAASLGEQAYTQEVTEQAHALDVMVELRRCFERVTLLFDACDRWLRDPADPSRYDIGPRAEDIQVTYAVGTRKGGVQQREKAALSQLLSRVEEGGVVVERWETKYADPRELALKTAAQLKAQLELLAKLMGQLDERAQVNVLLAPEWLALRSALFQALAPYPAARQAVAQRLLTLEGGAYGAGD